MRKQPPCPLPPELFMGAGRRPGAQRASATVDGGRHVAVGSDRPRKEAAADPSLGAPVRDRLLALLLAFAAVALLAPLAVAQTPDQRVALDAAERWLVPVDEQRYADAWAMASESFKKQVSREQWREGIRKIRKDYGRVVTRKGDKLAYVGVKPASDYPTSGPQEGMQIAILFDTKFAGNKDATEEVTMIYEKDGLWRVAGYFIR